MSHSLFMVLTLFSPRSKRGKKTPFFTGFPGSEIYSDAKIPSLLCALRVTKSVKNNIQRCFFSPRHVSSSFKVRRFFKGLKGHASVCVIDAENAYGSSLIAIIAHIETVSRERR